jgi:hypothetical protein
VYESETNGMMTQFPKICMKYDKKSFLFNEYLFNGKRKSRFHYQTLDKECPQSNFVLDQIQYDATTFQKCKLIIKMHFCCLYATDNQFNAKFLLPTTLLDQGDSDKKTQILHKQHTLLQSNKRNKTKNAKRRRKRLDQMTLKNQMRSDATPLSQWPIAPPGPSCCLARRTQRFFTPLGRIYPQ